MFIPNYDMFESGQMILSDRWYVDSSEALFFSYDKSELIKIDFRTKDLSFINKIPEMNNMRGCSGCLKIGDYIYAFPDTNKFVWKYDINSVKWDAIAINNPNEVRLGVYQYWLVDDDVILLYSYGLRCLLYLSTTDDTVYKYAYIFDEEDVTGKAELVGNYLYITSTGDVDCLILDTAHCLPGEVLDFLALLPYLRDGAVVLYLLDNWTKFSSHGTINPYRDGGIVLWDEKQVSLFFLMWIVDIWKARHVLARFKHRQLTGQEFCF